MNKKEILSVATLVVIGLIVVFGIKFIIDEKYGKYSDMQDYGAWLSDGIYEFGVGETFVSYTKDEYKPGKYKFYSSADGGLEYPGIYDIYVEREPYMGQDGELNTRDIVCTVHDKYAPPCEIDLESGDYVYVVPQVVKYEVDGGLVIERK